jgi:hypothetical protein
MRTISTCGKTQLVTTIDPNTKKPIITTVITEQPKKEIANVLELTPPIEDAINL